MMTFLQIYKKTTNLTYNKSDNMRKYEYDVEVVFSVPINVTVKANDKYEAMDIAEDMAYDIFKKEFSEGKIVFSDFDYEAQTPWTIQKL